jgi:hypothetical protein
MMVHQWLKLTRTGLVWDMMSQDMSRRQILVPYQIS